MPSSKFEVIAVTTTKDGTQLYDIYVDDRWIGSRRTFEYALALRPDNDRNQKPK